jgi:AhpD family alkylhydroperoxidase
MEPRHDYRKAAPAAIDALAGINRYLDTCAIDAKLRLLIEVRVSQLNGCAYCVNLHVQQARQAGESQQRLDCLCVWREVSLFDERERAALGWAEALTRIAATHDGEDVAYAQARAQFDDKALVDLALVVAGMNAWNRIGVGFRPAVRAR